MSNSKNLNVEEIIKELSVDYVEALPAVVDRLEAFTDQNNLSQIREEFHKLKGTGKPYGLDEITVLGETMERICVAFAEDAIEFIPTAISILEKIYETRIADRRFSIEDDGDFNAINNYVAIH